MPSENTPMPLGHMMFNGRQRSLRTVAPYSTNSGSDDSQTLLGSYSSICQTASQDEVPDPNFDTPDDLPYAFPSEDVSIYPPVGGTGE